MLVLGELLLQNLLVAVLQALNMVQPLYDSFDLLLPFKLHFLVAQA